MDVKQLTSERRESRGRAKQFALAHQVLCPANAEQGTTCLLANDATGKKSLPRKNGRAHDLITCQPSASKSGKSCSLPSTSNLGKSCTLPSTSILWKISHASEYHEPLENLRRNRVPRTSGNYARLRVPRFFGISRTLRNTSALWKF